MYYTYSSSSVVSFTLLLNLAHLGHPLQAASCVLLQYLTRAVACGNRITERYTRRDQIAQPLSSTLHERLPLFVCRGMLCSERFPKCGCVLESLRFWPHCGCQLCSPILYASIETHSSAVRCLQQSVLGHFSNAANMALRLDLCGSRSVGSTCGEVWQ